MELSDGLPAPLGADSTIRDLGTPLEIDAGFGDRRLDRERLLTLLEENPTTHVCVIIGCRAGAWRRVDPHEWSVALRTKMTS